jgi:hypothetical protein
LASELDLLQPRNFLQQSQPSSSTVVSLVVVHHLLLVLALLLLKVVLLVLPTIHVDASDTQLNVGIRALLDHGVHKPCNLGSADASASV